MEFTPEQITEIISEITNGDQGFQCLVKQGLESLMAHVKNKVDLLFSVVSARFFSGENLLDSK